MTRTRRLAWLGLATAGWRAVQWFRSMDLRGRVALVTGGSRGLGLALARELADQGCRVAICARDEATLERARRDLERRAAMVMAVRCDVSDRDDVQRLVETVTARWGDIDVLVNNAGIIQVGPLEAMRIEDFERAMAVNFWGAVHLTQAVLPSMRARGGRIVNITSIGGKVAVPHLLPYSAAKFALVGFSEGLCVEARKHGIAVTTVVPGLMRTGSPLHVELRGRGLDELLWFGLGDATPLTAMSAERAARRIVRALRRGEAEVTLSLSAKLVRLVHALAPTLTMDALALVDRLLPGASHEVSPSVEPARADEVLARSDGRAKRALSRLLETSARRYNQQPGAR